MSGSRAIYFADAACQERVNVVENVRLARDTYRVRFRCPQIAARIVPGQFVMLRLAGGDDPLLARPLALYDTQLDAEGRPQGLDLVYLVVGRMTSRLAQMRPGQPLDVWGPLGNGFAPAPVEHLVMVAGGIGVTPFLALGRYFLAGRLYGSWATPQPPSRRVTLCYGVRTADYFAGLEDFKSCGIAVELVTEDGSAGRQGLVTERLAELLDRETDSVRVVACGPEPMMDAVARLTEARGVACQVSLETPMACGLGICFSCVAKVRDAEGGWDYRRTCVEGPVFDAREIVFD